MELGNGSVCADATNVSGSGLLQDSPSGFLSSSAILRLSPCLHRSLEGLNQELEEVFVKEQGDEELLRVSEGHEIALNLLGGLRNPFLHGHSLPVSVSWPWGQALCLASFCSRRVNV